MSRSRILSSLAAASLGIALLGACSAESLTERAVSFGLEQAIEGDQDIDLDFSDDGTGGFSISTDEGDFAINFDDESGGIVYNTDEGDGVISFDEDGIVYNTDEGDGVISFDQDAGTINFETDQGDGVVNIDEDTGAVTFATEDGGGGTFGGNEIPAGWPANVGVPASLVSGSQVFSEIDYGSEGILISGTFEHADNDPFAKNAVEALEANGWTLSFNASENGGTFAMLTNGTAAAQVIGDGGYSSVVLQGLSS